MQRMMTIGGAVALALVAGSAFAAESCQSRLQAILSEAPDLTRMPAGQQVLAKRTLRDLRSAAEGLQRDGFEAACNATLDALAKAETEYHLMIAHPEPLGSVMGNAGQPAEAPPAPVAQKDRLVPFNAAGPLDTGRLRGSAVYNGNGEIVGDFAGLITTKGGAATHMLIGYGNFWNIFDKEAAVPLDIVKWDPQNGIFYVPLTKKELSEAPEYDKGKNWQVQANDRYYASLGG